MAEIIDPTTKPYIPIDTDLVDDLEHFAVDRIHVRIQYIDHTSTHKELRGTIAEIFTANHEEFLKMQDGRAMRLDQIVQVLPDQELFKIKSANQE
jgi:hypothetical protein